MTWVTWVAFAIECGIGFPCLTDLSLANEALRESQVHRLANRNGNLRNWECDTEKDLFQTSVFSISFLCLNDLPFARFNPFRYRFLETLLTSKFDVDSTYSGIEKLSSLNTLPIRVEIIEVPQSVEKKQCFVKNWTCTHSWHQFCLIFTTSWNTKSTDLSQKQQYLLFFSLLESLYIIYQRVDNPIRVPPGFCCLCL